MSSDPIPIKGVGHIKIPTVRQVRDMQMQYNTYINLLDMDSEDLLENSLFSIDTSNSKDDSVFNLILKNQTLVEFYLEALSFFFIEHIREIPDYKSWVLVDEQNNLVGIINNDNFDMVRDIILQSNCISHSSHITPKFKNEKAKAIFEKIAQKKKEAKKQGKQNQIGLGNIVSYLCSQNCGYTFFNIWDLTIYQLFDQFFRQNIKVQTDIYGIRWAAFGEQPFDFSIYYQSPNYKDNGG